MPELPEVQTIVNDLNKNILNKRIKRIDVRLPKIVKGKPKEFQKFLEGNSFQDIFRRGKSIIIKLVKGRKYLFVHLRMTGQIIYVNQNKLIAGGHGVKVERFDLPSKQTHLIIYFQDGSILFYNDQRQFGYWQIINNLELERVQEKLGIEPLAPEFTLTNFKKLLVKQKGNIKAFLLNQKHIAGLGNIYVDESLFKSRISPLRSMSSLSLGEIKRLYQSIKDTLNQAIRYRGTTFNDYVDAQGQKGKFIRLLKVYQREGQKCLTCSRGIIKKIKVAGRGTRYCPFCQK